MNGAAGAAEAPRVVLVAENASARFGGEAALPLHYFRVLERRGVPVWLVTHGRTRGELAELYPGSERIVYVEDSRWHRFLWRLGLHLPPMVSQVTTGFLSRLSTQRAQRRIVRRLVREHRIDVVHQPMPVSPKEPSLLYGFGVPVVIGPLNGGMDYPPAFRGERGRVERALLAVGRASAALLNRVWPGKRRAAALLVANERTRRALPSGLATRVYELVENGVDLGVWHSPVDAPPPDRDAPVTFAFMGRLVAWKAAHVLLQAFASAHHAAPMRLLVLGDGDERERLEALASDLGIAINDRDDGPRGSVRFAGWLSQAECAARLARADVLALPSVLECGGAVVLEAMSLAKPVIATAWGGPLDYLDADCGVLVEPTSPQALVDGFADAMVALAREPALRARLGANARAKIAAHFDWERKVDRVLDIYRDVIGPAPAAAARHGDGTPNDRARGAPR